MCKTRKATFLQTDVWLGFLLRASRKENHSQAWHSSLPSSWSGMGEKARP